MSMLIDPYRFGPAPGTWATWNPSDKSGLLTLSDSNRVATATSGSTTVRSIRATHPIPAGKSYFEIVLSVFTPNNLIIALGIADIALNVGTQYVGQTGASWGLWGRYMITNNRKYHNGVAVGNFAGQFSAGVVIGIAADMGTGHLWWAVNNSWVEGAPAAGTGASYTNLTGKGSLYPAASIYGMSDAVRLRANPAEHSYAPPSGFTAGVPG